MRTAIVGAAALALLVSSGSLAHADGMPANPDSSYTPFSWTGFYIGANGGFGYNYDQRDIILSNNLGMTVTTRGLQPEGGFGGGQIGYNWQRGPLLLGVEADLQGADVSEGFSGRPLDAGGDFLNAHEHVDYFGTARGRIGFAFYRGLIYVTGGFAYGGVRDQLLVSSPGTGFSADLNRDDTRTGSTVGGGLELAIAPHWSVKVEYQLIDLGSERLTAPVAPPNGTTITSNRIEDRVDTIRVGLNYRFDTDRYYVPMK
jgi:outer membrane immunogenic protein